MPMENLSQQGVELRRCSLQAQANTQDWQPTAWQACIPQSLSRPCQLHVKSPAKSDGCLTLKGKARSSLTARARRISLRHLHVTGLSQYAITHLELLVVCLCPLQLALQLGVLCRGSLACSVPHCQLLLLPGNDGLPPPALLLGHAQIILHRCRELCEESRHHANAAVEPFPSP